MSIFAAAGLARLMLGEYAEIVDLVVINLTSPVSAPSYTHSTQSVFAQQ